MVRWLGPGDFHCEDCGHRWTGLLCLKDRLARVRVEACPICPDPMQLEAEAQAQRDALAPMPSPKPLLRLLPGGRGLDAPQNRNTSPRGATPRAGNGPQRPQGSDKPGVTDAQASPWDALGALHDRVGQRQQEVDARLHRLLRLHFPAETPPKRPGKPTPRGEW